VSFRQSCVALGMPASAGGSAPSADGDGGCGGDRRKPVAGALSRWAGGPVRARGGRYPVGGIPVVHEGR